MDAEYREALTAYRASMSLAESMLLKGIITEKDYADIDRKKKKKYDLPLASICCRKPLIDGRIRGNMRHTEGGGSHGQDNQKS